MKQLSLSVILLLLLISCGRQSTTESTNTRDEKIPVKVIKAELREYNPAIELTGTAFADKEANLGAALPGRVEKIYFPEGSRVKKGDLLVSLSGEMYTQSIAELNTLTKDFERVTRLNEKGSISQQDYDHVKALFEASKAKAEMMKKNAEIVAPFSGTIIEYLVKEGENYFFNLNVDPGYSHTSGILRLMKLDPVQVEAEVNEKDLRSIKIGQKAKITFDAVADSAFRGEISTIKPVLSTMTHTATIKIRVANGSSIIRPGMFAHVVLQYQATKGVTVPVNAITRQAGQADEYLFVVENDKVKKVKIDRLWSDNAWVAVKGISAGDNVVTAGKEKLHDGSPIEIK
jgi:membrane fusion protein, multidrug efflux system